MFIVKRKKIGSTVRAYHCCRGRIGVLSGSLLIGLAELIALLIGGLQLAQIVVDDGDLFYTDYLTGYGLEIGILSFIYCATAVTVTMIMVYGVKRRVSM